MPRYNRILNMPGFSIKKVSGYQPLFIEVVYTRRLRCAHCQSKQVRKKASFMRTVRHEAIGRRLMQLRFKAYKLYCHACKRYGNSRYPGIGKYQRATQRLKNQIYDQHTAGVSQKSLAQQFKLGKATVERWYHEFYHKNNKEFSNYFCPMVLGIDEHFFSRKQGYATTLCDLRKQKIFDIVKGKSAAALGPYLQALEQKDRVRVVCMDLSNTYRHLIKRYFPQAKIVADRFHVIRLLHHQCQHVYRSLLTALKSHRTILRLLRTREDRLSEKNRVKRNEFLKNHPAVAAVYRFQQKLYDLLMKKTRTQKQCQRLISQFLPLLHSLKQSPFKPLARLGKTLYQWREEIVRMWRFSKSNGITEGFHRKMKLIQRRAYGFRNFENYRTRVRVLCS